MKETKVYKPTDWIDPRIVIRPSLIQGKGMFATSQIKKDEIVNIWGGTRLLSEEDLGENQSNEWQASGYVWATIGEGIYLARMLREDEEDLTNFINHLCDPNIWMLNEVTLVARRDIFVGEELTVDYAMFEGTEDWVAHWKCHCGSEICRSRLSGRAWRRKDLQERYQNHFSPFICERIRRLQFDEG